MRAETGVFTWPLRAWWVPRVQKLPRSAQWSTHPHRIPRHPLPSSPWGGGYALPPEPHLAGNCAPLSHVLDEGQELLLSPGQVEEKKLWQPD